MNYVSILREVITRLRYHKEHGIGDDAPILENIKIKEAGEFRVDTQKDLPLVTLVDLTANDSAERGGGRITLFIRTDRKKGWVRTDDDKSPGLFDYVELIMDAVELSPSTGKADLLLCLHNADGTSILDATEEPVNLLVEDFTWDGRMSEITDLSFLYELDLVFTLPTGRRGRRRTALADRLAAEA